MADRDSSDRLGGETPRTNGGGQGPVAFLRQLLTSAAATYALLVIVGLVVGLQVAPYAVSVADPGDTQSRVAIIRVSGGITGVSANAVAAQIERARADPRVEAIVLRINSPGGGAAASEQLYLSISRAAAEMPVVASVNTLAASGGYYAAVAADYIFVKPASLVGSVGVIFVAPAELPPVDRLVITGPSKLSGGDLRSWYYKIDAAKQAFVGAVVRQRGDRLSIDRSEIATARLFSGPRSVQTGLTDEIGGLQAAIEYAAEQASVDSYQVSVFATNTVPTFVTRTAYTGSAVQEKRLVGPEYFVGNGTGAAGPNILMLAPSVALQAVDDRVLTAQEFRRVMANRTSNSSSLGGESYA